MKTIKALIIVALCGLLPGCTLMKDYDIDTSPDGVRDRTIVEHFEEYDYNQNCLLFCKAARWSGLLDELEAGGRTVVVPNDNAMKAFMTELGVTQIEEIHPNLLRALMRYLIFPGDYRALNMTPVEMDGNTIKNPEEVTWVESLAGYPIGIARGPSSRNKYRMGIITPGTTTVITVAQQDYVFKNQMVAQVVPTFPTYRATPIGSESVPQDFEIPVDNFSVDLVEDTHVYQSGGGSSMQNTAANGSYLVSRNNVLRYTLMKFPLPALQDIEELEGGLGQIRLTLSIKGGLGYSKGDAITIDIHELEDNDWSETTLTWNDLPKTRNKGALSNEYRATAQGALAGTVSFVYSSSFTLPELLVMSEVTDVTKKRIEEGAQMISYILSDASAGLGDPVGSSVIYIRSKDASTEANRYISQLIFTARFPTELRVVRNEPFRLVGSEAILSTANLAMAGPAVPSQPSLNYVPQNIIYKVASLPTKGTLLTGFKELAVGDKFTQADLAQMAIKYVRLDGIGDDTFQLQVSDYVGGEMYEPVTVRIIE